MIDQSYKYHDSYHYMLLPGNVHGHYTRMNSFPAWMKGHITRIHDVKKKIMQDSSQNK